LAGAAWLQAAGMALGAILHRHRSQKAHSKELNYSTPSVE
jgi:hypothetical protein